MITCRELSRLVTDYFDGVMSPAKRLGIRFHLLLCKDCRVHLVKMRQLITALDQISNTNMPHSDDVVERLLEVARKPHP